MLFVKPIPHLNIQVEADRAAVSGPKQHAAETADNIESAIKGNMDGRIADCLETCNRLFTLIEADKNDTRTASHRRPGLQRDFATTLAGSEAGRADEDPIGRYQSTLNVPGPERANRDTNLAGHEVGLSAAADTAKFPPLSPFLLPQHVHTSIFCTHWPPDALALQVQMDAIITAYRHMRRFVMRKDQHHFNL